MKVKCKLREHNDPSTEWFLVTSSAIGSVRSLRFESLSVLRCLRVRSKSRSQFKSGKDKDRRPCIRYWFNSNNVYRGYIQMKKEKQNFRSYCFCNAVAPVVLSEGSRSSQVCIFARANNFARARLSFRSSHLCRT
jgi:hypothetical protein